MVDEDLRADVPVVSKRDDGSACRIAILCSPMYSSTCDLEQCVRWVPGWYASEMPETIDVDSLVGGTLVDAKSRMLEKQKALKQQIQDMDPHDSDDHDLLQSIHFNIDETQVQYENLCQMIGALRDNFGIVSKPTAGDGDCGIHTAVAFAENSPFSTNTGPGACRQDVDAIVSAYREEIKLYWQGVQDDPLWQQILMRFVDGRVDLTAWREDAEPEQFSTPCRSSRPKRNQKMQASPMTPPGKPTPPSAKRRRKDVPFTPDKGDSGSLLGCGEAQPHSIIISAEQSQIVPATGEPGKAETAEKVKKKRTGKPLPAAQTITFPKEFAKYLGERGVTYHRWVKAHIQELVFVCFGLCFSVLHVE